MKIQTAMHAIQDWSLFGIPWNNTEADNKDQPAKTSQSAVNYLELNLAPPYILRCQPRLYHV